MKKIVIFILVFMAFFSVNADEADEYNKAVVKINEAYDKFIGGCNNGERVAIIKYAHGDLDKLSGGYTTVKTLTTNNGNVISDICANYVEDFYEAIKYADNFDENYTLYSFNLVTTVEVMTNLLVNGSRITSREDLTIIEDCKLIDKEFKNVLNEYLGYLQIVCVCITILLIITDLYKLFISKELNNKNVFKKIKGRIIALIIVLLVPVIVNIIIGLINKYVSIEAIKCLES